MLQSLPSEVGLSPSQPCLTAADGRMLLSRAQCWGALEDGEVRALVVGCVCAVGQEWLREQGEQVEKASANARWLQPGLTSTLLP